MLNVSTFKTRVAPKLHGTSLAKVVDFYGKMHEASGNLFSNVKPYTVIRVARIDNAIYDRLTNYTCQDDCEVDAIIDIRPIGPRGRHEDTYGDFSKEFDIKKPENTYTIEYVNGVKTLRLSKCLTARTMLYSADTLSDGYTVSGSGDITSTSLDYVDYVAGRSSVAMALSGVDGQGILTINLLNPVNLNGLQGQGSILPWFKFSDASRLTNVKIRVGSSSSDYYETICTAALNQGFTSDQWLTILQNIKTATSTGAPNLGALNFIQIEINYQAGIAQTAHIDSITAALGKAYEVVYYSNRLFTDSSGLTWKEIPTSDNDLIRLEGAQDNNAFLYEFMLTLQQEIKGKNMESDYSYFNAQLHGRFNSRGAMMVAGLYESLQSKYPNQSIIRSTEYFHFEDIGSEGEDHEDWGVSIAAPMPEQSSGTTSYAEVVTAVSYGSGTMIDLSQLAFKPSSIIFLVLNGQILTFNLDPTQGFPTWTGSISQGYLVVYNASPSDTYQLYYTY